MIPDPTEEIKAIRHRLGAEMEFDLGRIIADIQQRQKDSGRTYIRLPKREPQRSTLRRFGRVLFFKCFAKLRTLF